MKWLPIVAVVLIIGCKKQNTANDSFNEKIAIKMQESLHHELLLNCATVKIFECSNYVLKSSFHVSDDQIVLEFSGIDKGSFCLTALGPASTSVNLGKLSNGSYVISFQTGTQLVKGTLEISDSQYHLSLPSPGNIELSNPVMER